MLRVVFRQVGEGERLEVRVEGEGLQDAPWRRIEAPLSPRELEDLRWYVEEFMDLPVGGYAVKAKRVEEQMAAAGRRLLDAVFDDRHTGAALDRTLRHETADRWLEVAAEPGTSAEPLAWPWELLHDGNGFLATRRLRVRRTLPRGSVTPPRPAGAEAARRTRGLRVLVIVCRPDDQGLVSPRATVDAMLRAVADQPVRVDVCRLGTLAELGKMLGRAIDTNDPYDIVHINAHGSFDRKRGASLAFEKEPDDDGRIMTDSVTPEKLGEMLHDKGVDLVLLEACQSAMTDREAPLTAGFAQGLLQKGIRAVIAMGYTVHVDATATLFGALYQRIAEGAAVGDALGTARERLRDEPRRRMGFGPAHERGEVELRDWFVPQLYQHGDDRALLAPGTAATPPPKPPSLRRSAPNRPEPGAFPGEPPHDFVGRVAELHRVARALERARAVLVHGLAGTGKTTLAGEVASWALRTRRFEDACFVDFRTVVSEGHALSIMGAALAGAQAVDRAAVVAAFRKRPVLAVWDNLETLSETPTEEVAALGALFRELVEDDGGAAVEGRLLMTSRDPTAADWKVPVRIPLGGLWQPDARELLSRVLRNAEPPIGFRDVLEREGRATGKAEADAITDAGRKAIDELLEFLGDHPLSIELVGPALATERAAAIREGLVERLAAARGAEAPEGERLRKLEASLAWSIGRLDEGARNALQWLALFRGGVFEDILVRISQLDAERWGAARAQLERGGLIAVNWATQVNRRPYLVLHPTLALLGAGALEGDPQVRRRFADTYDALVGGIYRGRRGSAADFRGALDVYHKEEANITRAIGWASPELAALLRRTAADCLESLGRTAEARRLAAVKLSESVSWEARIHQALALTSTHPQEGLRQLENYADELAKDPPGSEPEDAAFAFAVLGRALLEVGRPREGVQPLEEAVRRYRTLTAGQPISLGAALWVNLSAALGDLGNAYRILGALGKAETVVREGIKISDVRQDRRNAAVGRGQIAAVLMAQGRRDDARLEYERALKIAVETGDRGLAGAIEQHLGSLKDDARDYEAANVHYRRALDLFLLAGDRAGAMRTRNLLGVLEQNRGDISAARAWYSAALEDARGLGQDDQEAATLQNLGILTQKEALAARAAGDERGALRSLEDAAEQVQRSLKIEERLGHDGGEASSWSQLGIIRKLQGRFAEARDSLLRGVEIRERLGLVEIYKDYANLAEMATALGDAVEAEQWRAKADHARATATFLAGRPTFLTSFARIAAEARRGSLAAAAKENEALASGPGWLGILARFLADTASGASPPLPAAVPDEAADVIRRVLAGEDPSKVLDDHLPSDAEPASGDRPPRPSPGRDPREPAMTLSSAALFSVDAPPDAKDHPMASDLLARIDQLPPDVALRALAVLRGELTGDDLELRRALEDAPDEALAALAAALPDLTPSAADPAAVARQALALVARDASEERRALVEEALTAPAPETLTSTLEVIGVLSLAVFALKSRVEIAYDKKKGFSFHLRKDASSDTLVRSVLSGLLSLGRK